MSSLLTSLADRAMGKRPAIEPVRSPIFAGASAATEQDGAGEAASFSYADIISSAEPMQSSDPQPPMAPVHIVTEHTDTAPESMPSSPVQATLKPAALHEFPGDQPEIQGTQQPQSTNPAESAPVQASAVKFIESVVVESKPKPSPAEFTPVASAQARAGDSLSPRQQPGLKAIDVAPERQAFPDLPAPGSTEPSLRPQLFSERPVISRDMADKLPQQVINKRVEQPTIKVTIGRIEVRSMTTPPAQPQQQSRKTKPSLSLDDYLKQRAGGQR